MLKVLNSSFMVNTTRTTTRKSQHGQLLNTILSSLILTIASFNVRGLGNVIKQEELGLDCDKSRLDVTAIQETKIKNDIFIEKTLPTHQKLFIFEQKDRHGRIGFIISKRLVPYIV